MSVIPYVITTKRLCQACYANSGDEHRPPHLVSRRAVATPGEAQEEREKLVRLHVTDSDEFERLIWEPLTVAITLPDGTVIEVEQISAERLASEIDHLRSDFFEDSSLIDAYNARQGQP